MAQALEVSHCAGWSSDRYAVFIAGRTGSLKTSFGQALMCVYGAGFAEDQCASEISWETEVWVAEAETHLIHFDGERFLGPHRA